MVVIVSQQEHRLAAFPRTLTAPLPLETLQGIILENRSLWQQNKTERLDSDETHSLVFSVSQGALSFGSMRLVLSDYESKVLLCLIEAFGDVVKREALNRILGVEKGNMADVYVCRLRKKLENFYDRTVIRTIRGIGYQLAIEIQKDA